MRDSREEGGHGDRLNPLRVLAGCHAACLTPFIRTQFGVEYPGWGALGACLIMFCYAGFAVAPEMIVYFWLWVVAIIYQRCATMSLVRRGWREHSRYNGRPALAMRLTGARDELNAKSLIEPALCVVIGVVLCPISTAIGVFVAAGGVSIALSTGIDLYRERLRVRRMRDAAMEMRRLAQMYRNGE